MKQISQSYGSLKLNELITNNKEIVLSSSIAPWQLSDGYSFNTIIQNNCFIDSNIMLQTQNSDCSLNSITNLLERENVERIIVLGEAGSGKSFLLKKVFIDLISKGKKALYISSLNYNGLNELSQYVNQILDFKIVPPKDLVLIFDGIDERFATNYKKLDSFISKICDIDCSVWLGCRKIFFDNNKCFDGKPLKRIYVKQWTLEHMRKFVNCFPFRTKNFSRKFDKLLSDYDLEKFLNSPLKLSMFTYIIDNETEEACEQYCKEYKLVDNIYYLYKSFLRKWINNELKRFCLNNKESETVISQWQTLARIIYDKKSEEECGIRKDPVIASILIVESKDNVSYWVKDFFHRSFIEFLLAKKVIDSILKDPTSVITVLKNNNRSDVDYYIKQAFLIMKESEKSFAIKSLTTAYSKVKIEISNPDDAFYVKNQIVYLLTRMGSTDQRIRTFVKKAYFEEEDPIMKQGIAYGAANIGVFDVALEFAKKMLDPNSIENLINRSWTLVFYGDQPGKDPIYYRDDGSSPWKRSKEARMRRLKGTGSKDKAFRLFDLCILHGFYESRGWKDLSQEDLQVIKETDIKIVGGDDTMKRLLADKKLELIEQYCLHIDKNN